MSTTDPYAGEPADPYAAEPADPYAEPTAKPKPARKGGKNPIAQVLSNAAQDVATSYQQGTAGFYGTLANLAGKAHLEGIQKPLEAAQHIAAPKPAAAAALAGRGVAGVIPGIVGQLPYMAGKYMSPEVAGVTSLAQNIDKPIPQMAGNVASDVLLAHMPKMLQGQPAAVAVPAQAAAGYATARAEGAPEQEAATSGLALGALGAAAHANVEEIPAYLKELPADRQAQIMQNARIARQIALGPQPGAATKLSRALGTADPYDAVRDDERGLPVYQALIHRESAASHGLDIGQGWEAGLRNILPKTEDRELAMAAVEDAKARALDADPTRAGTHQLAHLSPADQAEIASRPDMQLALQYLQQHVMPHVESLSQEADIPTRLQSDLYLKSVAVDAKGNPINPPVGSRNVGGGTTSPSARRLTGQAIDYSKNSHLIFVKTAQARTIPAAHLELNDALRNAEVRPDENGVVPQTMKWAGKDVPVVEVALKRVTHVGDEANPDMEYGPGSFSVTMKRRGATPPPTPEIPAPSEGVGTPLLPEQTPPAPASPVEDPFVTANARYPHAGKTVDGLDVRDEIPNMSSIGASLTDYKILPGIREVPYSDFGEAGHGYADVAGNEHVRRLADAIKESGEINPLIVVVDKDGPYILEGGHRWDALHAMGKTSFPAKIVVDYQDHPFTEQEETTSTPPASEPTQPASEHRGAATEITDGVRQAFEQVTAGKNMSNAEKKTLLDSMIQEATSMYQRAGGGLYADEIRDSLNRPPTGPPTGPPQITPPEGAGLPPTPAPIAGNVPPESDNIFLPKPLADAYQRVLSPTPFIEKPLQSAQNFLTDVFLNLGIVAEQARHGLNVVNVAGATEGQNAISKTFLPAHIIDTVRRGYQFAPEDQTRLIDILQRNGAMRSAIQTSELRPMETGQNTAIKGIQNVLHEIPGAKQSREAVFGNPLKGRLGLENRLRMTMLDSMLRSGLDETAAAKVVRDSFGSNVSRLTPNLAKIMGVVDPFSRAFVSLGKSGIRSVLGVSAATGKFDPAIFARNWGSVYATWVATNMAADPQHRPPWETNTPWGQFNLPYLTNAKQRVSVGMDAVFALMNRGELYSGQKGAIEEMSKPSTTPDAIALQATRSLLNVPFGHLAGAPSIRPIFNLATGGREPWITPRMTLLKGDRKGKTSFGEGAKLALQHVIPAVGNEIEAQDAIPQVSGGRTIASALGLLGIRLKVQKQPGSKPKRVPDPYDAEVPDPYADTTVVGGGK